MAETTHQSQHDEDIKRGIEYVCPINILPALRFLVTFGNLFTESGKIMNSIVNSWVSTAPEGDMKTKLKYQRYLFF